MKFYEFRMYFMMILYMVFLSYFVDIEISLFSVKEREEWLDLHLVKLDSLISELSDPRILKVINHRTEDPSQLNEQIQALQDSWNFVYSLLSDSLGKNNLPLEESELRNWLQTRAQAVFKAEGRKRIRDDIVRIVGEKDAFEYDSRGWDLSKPENESVPAVPMVKLHLYSVYKTMLDSLVKRANLIIVDPRGDIVSHNAVIYPQIQPGSEEPKVYQYFPVPDPENWKISRDNIEEKLDSTRAVPQELLGEVGTKKFELTKENQKYESYLVNFEDQVVIHPASVLYKNVNNRIKAFWGPHRASGAESNGRNLSITSDGYIIITGNSRGATQKITFYFDEGKIAKSADLDLLDKPETDLTLTFFDRSQNKMRSFLVGRHERVLNTNFIYDLAGYFEISKGASESRLFSRMIGNQVDKSSISVHTYEGVAFESGETGTRYPIPSSRNLRNGIQFRVEGKIIRIERI